MENKKSELLKEQLRQQITTDPKTALKTLKRNLKDESRFFNSVLQLQLQLNNIIETERFQLSGTSDTETAYAQVTKAFLDILREIYWESLRAPTINTTMFLNPYRR